MERGEIDWGFISILPPPFYCSWNKCSSSDRETSILGLADQGVMRIFAYHHCIHTCSNLASFSVTLSRWSLTIKTESWKSRFVYWHHQPILCDFTHPVWDWWCESGQKCSLLQTGLYLEVLEKLRMHKCFPEAFETVSLVQPGTKGRSLPSS